MMILLLDENIKNSDVMRLRAVGFGFYQLTLC